MDTFSWEVRVGLAFKFQAACVSAISILGLLSYLIYQTFRIRKSRGSFSCPTHLHIFVISLVCSDMFESISTIMGIRWLLDGRITEGPYCTAEAMIRNTGNVGVALAILAIAVSTWGVIVRRWSCPSPKVAIGVVALIWTFAFLMVMVSYAVHKSERFYGSTTYWCFIRPPYSYHAGIALVYTWYWLTATGNLVLYVSVAYKIIDSRRQRPQCVAIERTERIYAPAYQHRLSYPIVYLVIIIPTSVTRIWQFARPDHPPSAAFIIVAGIIFSSSGWMNVMLYCFTRPSLIHPHDEPSPTEHRSSWVARRISCAVSNVDGVPVDQPHAFSSPCARGSFESCSKTIEAA
ncbi:hypothetical protein SISNIDRAFT_487344 [Sistotremastrum niveocremeum HHB9708]|uniref:G-protein coupled receptors family 1 profile domain-containing protein n=1 Tax=Sistotremastrum niveocremeum HHB9708 TaxID=1314777 RepID=A0A164SPX5_9AGAM|nr:hypothetical protein SISNIDRAFT_487344 [Sistotremastrum niveocremeum HHB9708]